MPSRAHFLPLLVTALTLAVPPAARAQSGQEKIVQEKLERSGTLEYTPAGKAFSTNATFGGRQAAVRPFGFSGRTANTNGGDGTFQARGFNDGRGSFRTDHFAVRQATAVSKQALPEADRAYSTRAVDVREDRAASHSLDSRAYVNSGNPSLCPASAKTPSTTCGNRRI